ncbi:hypothetical protein A8L34_04955 [Bacillus sp. FJAT-27264]|uniref:hypothetical protein n=1 Tax=Paenibacillus sp. (strain DSM 101736 / FJAT-27264) TaxID=1850362 RepID=UPI000807A483|nr:hypothetical protein [Bacillus sp. FJAT-27264]OBZ18901.1 hypothetical protein A8L34_04955 [Bacillus sp. FJAT-27264]
MLDFVLFMFFSVIESSALFYFAFKVFKIDLYIKEMIFAGFIMAFFSYTIRIVYGLDEIDILVQYLLVFCFLWQLFRIHIFYAAIMTGMAYQTYMLIQSLVYLILNRTLITTLHVPTNSIRTYFLQCLSALLVFSIAFYVGKKRKGFDFIPDKPDGKINISRSEKILFTLSFPSITMVVLMLYLFNNTSPYFSLMPLFYAIILYSYLYLSRKKNLGDTI